MRKTGYLWLMILFIVLALPFGIMRVVQSKSVEPVVEATSLKYEEEEVKEESTDQEYKIVQSGDLHINELIVTEYWVVPSDIFLGKRDIKRIGKEIIEKVKKEKVIEEIDVFFIDDKRQVHNGFTIGRVSYSRKNQEVPVGDYKDYQYSYVFGSVKSEKMPKDYKKGEYPTKEELDIYFHWLSLVRMNESEEQKEEALIQTAQKFHLAYDVTKEIINKVHER